MPTRATRLASCFVTSSQPPGALASERWQIRKTGRLGTCCSNCCLAVSLCTSRIGMLCQDASSNTIPLRCKVQ